LCGGTGAWSRPYADAGYDVLVVDIERGMDVREYQPPVGVHGILAAPPCTMFSHARTTAKRPRDTRGAMEIVYACLRVIWECQYDVQTGDKKTSLSWWALENPGHGILNRFLGRPVFEFNPYDFGDDYKKKTYLWGYFEEPKKNPIETTKPKFDRLLTREIHPEYYGELTRQQRRAITPPGFAQAFFEANP